MAKESSGRLKPNMVGDLSHKKGPRKVPRLRAFLKVPFLLDFTYLTTTKKKNCLPSKTMKKTLKTIEENLLKKTLKNLLKPLEAPQLHPNFTAAAA